MNSHRDLLPSLFVLAAVCSPFVYGCGSNGDADLGGPGAAYPDPRVTVRIRSNTASFIHDDDAVGQTPLTASGGIRSLRLYRDAPDLAPVELFHRGATPVEVGYEDGDDTIVAHVEPAALPAGHYELARLVQTHSRFRIAGTMHDGADTFAGTFDDVKVMSDGTLLDGTMRDAGYYEYAFEFQGEKTVTTGEEPVPGWSTTAGAVGVVEDGEWAVYFPIDLTVPEEIDAGTQLIIDVNMYESFRWKDLPGPGYEPRIFDTTPISYEPVVRFGGNAFVMRLE